MKRLAIVGAGGFGREVAQLVEAINTEEDSQWMIEGFVDDDSAIHGRSFLGYQVMGGSTALQTRASPLEADAYVLAVGNGQVRRRLFNVLSRSTLQRATLIHPSIEVHRSVTIDPGAIVCNGATLTVDIRIGAHVIINLNSTIGHDAEIEAFATLHPGTHLSGNTHVGEACELGTGAVVLPGVRIGAKARVGAGAVVTEDVPAGATVVGVPARVVS